MGNVSLFFGTDLCAIRLDWEASLTCCGSYCNGYSCQEVSSGCSPGILLWTHAAAVLQLLISSGYGLARAARLQASLIDCSASDMLEGGVLHFKKFRKISGLMFEVPSDILATCS
jgi:hypothetical protein